MNTTVALSATSASQGSAFTDGVYRDHNGIAYGCITITYPQGEDFKDLT